MRGIRVKLRRVGIRIAQHIAGELYRHALHTHADTEARNPVLARVFQRREFPFHAARAEARRYHYALVTRQLCFHILCRQVIRQDGFQHQLTVVVRCSVGERLAYGLIGVLQLHILAHQRDLHLLLCALQVLQELIP